MLWFSLLLKKQTCDAEYTYPCRCPTNMGDERCNYNYGKLKASKGNVITEFKVVSISLNLQFT